MNMFDILLKTISDNRKGRIEGADALLDMVRHVKLFHFTADICPPPDQEDTLEDSIPDFSTVKDSQFMLPFDFTGLVHPDSVLILCDDKHKSVKNSFICLGMTRLPTNYRAEAYALYFGVIGIMGELSRENVRSAMKACYVILDNKTLPTPNDLEISAYCECLAIKQVFDLASINTLDRFIVEIAPSGMHPIRSAKYIPRSHQRPEYIILHPKAIRRIMRLPEQETQVHLRAGHERRAHLRHYPDDKERWPNMAGKTIKIAAVWIGPSEAEFEGKQYKVILD